MSMPVRAGTLEPDVILRKLCATGDAADYLSLISIQTDDLVVTAVNPAGESVFAVGKGSLVGKSFAPCLAEPESTRRSLAVLADGLVDSFRATRRLKLADNTAVEAPLWVRRVYGGGTSSALAILGLAVVDDTITVVSGRATADALPLVVAVIDEQWLIQTISVAAGVLSDPASLVGRPFSDLVHPDDLGHLLTALGSALIGKATPGTAPVRTGVTWTRCRVDLWPTRDGQRVSHTVMFTKQPACDAAGTHSPEQLIARSAAAVVSGAVADKPDLRSTTRSVRALLQQSATPLTSVEVAARLRTSRATAQRHLSELLRKGYVTVELEYGSVGRPSHAYQIRSVH